jgi:SAM-dependent methyltransferase
MSSNPVEDLAGKRSRRWYRLLRPPLPIYRNPAEARSEPPLGRWNLYIGGAGNRVDGYINVDLFPLPGVNVVCNAEELPFRSDCFDRVECDAVLEHTPRPAVVVNEIRRCLRRGGYVHIVVPFCHPFHEYPRDYYRFTPDGLRQLVDPLEVTSIGWRTGPTATLLAFLLEYLKLWFPNRTLKKAAYAAAGWLLFPLRYLDWLLLRSPDAAQMGNHCYVWARKNN